MHLDRVITVRLSTPGTRDAVGRWVPGPSTDHRVWTTRLSGPAERILESEGTRGEREARWIVRWFRELAERDPGEAPVEVLAEGTRSAGESDAVSRFIVTEIDEVDGAAVMAGEVRALRARRRWLRITAVEQKS